MNIFLMISTKNSLRYTAAGVKSFFDHTVLEAQDQFILIDNDGSLPQNLIATFPRATVIQPAQPRSFAGNCNYAIEIALQQKAHLFLLNNDLIFSRNWQYPLIAQANAVSSSLSNREARYQLSIELLNQTDDEMPGFILRNHMQLEDYLPHEAKFQAIAEAHTQTVRGTLAMISLPFSCIRIPLNILESVGLFDLRFGNAGGEDFDYCVRVWLAGFEVCFCLASYVLHFGGKSSWSGAESDTTRNEREQKFSREFATKWSTELRDIVFEFAMNPPAELKHYTDKGDFKSLIESVLARES